MLELQKFGIKLFIEVKKNYTSKKFIPEFHKWIQNESIKDHLLIDVADYSHIIDGPGVMLIAHEANISLDQENKKPGLLYMRKTKVNGDFKERFIKVLSMTIDNAKLLKNNTINQKINYLNNTFHFIANDRLYAENIKEKQNLYKKEIAKALIEQYPSINVDFSDFSYPGERLAFTVNIIDNKNILDL